MNSIEITYYTDPLCCWSWGMEPSVSQLLSDFGERVNLRYCMGGLLPNWERFTDPVNHVSRPIQMGPVWMHAARVSGTDIKHQLWYLDPPASSYPACIAFKTVELQSKTYAIIYLQMLRTACMLNGHNIAKREILFDLAGELRKEFPDFDFTRFEKEYQNGKGKEAFRSDLDEVQLKRITRFPTFIFRYDDDSLIATGYRPYSSLLEILHEMAPGIESSLQIRDS